MNEKEIFQELSDVRQKLNEQTKYILHLETIIIELKAEMCTISSSLQKYTERYGDFLSNENSMKLSESQPPPDQL